MLPGNPAPAPADCGSIGDPPGATILYRPKSAERRRGLATAIAFCTWLYLALVLVVWLLLRFGGDRWWLATVMLFGPRWLYAIPWVALVPVAALVRPRLLWPLAGAAVVLLGPIMGLCLPWARLVARDGPMVRVLTCNIDGAAVDVQRLAELVADTQPDVVALQECPVDLPLKWPAGWYFCRAGQLLIASPHPLRNEESVQNLHPPSPWPPVNGLRCSVAMPQGQVGFCCVALRTPRGGLSQVIDRQTLVSPARSTKLVAEIVERRLESEELVEWLQGWPGAWIAAGDFNMPADSATYRASWARYSNAFSVSGFGFGYTKWTPIHGWQYGLRIDHVLAAPGVKPRRCWVGPDIGSDHLPLIADLQWTE